MRTEIIHLSDDNENICGFAGESLRGSNRSEIRRKKRFILKAIKYGLTPQQQYCLTEYWLHGKKQKDIAAQLGLSNSTVSRHISAAIRKLKAAARYYPD